MATITITREELLALKPCNERRDAALSGINWGACASVDAAAARAAGVPFSDVLWVASALAQRDADVGRRVRLFVADCAARVLCLYEASPGATTAPRGAIVAARRFARGEIEAAAWDAAWAAARATAWDAAWAAAWAAARAAARAAAWDAAWDTAWAAAWDTAWAAAWAAARAAARAAAWDAVRAAAKDAAMAAAWDAVRAAAKDAAWAAVRATAWDAAWAAVRATAWDAAWAAEESWQFDRLIARLSADEPEDWPLPALPERIRAE